MRLEDELIREIGKTIKKRSFTRSDNGYLEQDPELFMENNYGKKNDDGSWTMESNFILRMNSPIVKNGKFIVKIKSVAGNFNCSGQNLITLEGGPKEVGGHFWCDFNKLTSLEYGPTKVGGIYSCSNNKLSNLKHIPKKLNDELDLSSNLLKDFSDFPKNIKGDLDIRYNKFKNFVNIPKVKGSIYYEFNPIKTFYGLTGKENLGYEKLDISNGEFNYVLEKLKKGKFDKEYFEGLFEHVIDYFFDDIKKIKWPKGFLNSKRKALISSKTLINKFNL